MKARTFVYGHHFPDNLMWHFSAHLSLTLYVNLEHSKAMLFVEAAGRQQTIESDQHFWTSDSL